MMDLLENNVSYYMSPESIKKTIKSVINPSVKTVKTFDLKPIGSKRPRGCNL